MEIRLRIIKVAIACQAGFIGGKGSKFSLGAQGDKGSYAGFVMECEDESEGEESSPLY